MSLFEAAKQARAHADSCTNPSCHAVANGLEAALDAEARDQMRELEPKYETRRLPTPEEGGFPAELHIEPPGD